MPGTKRKGNGDSWYFEVTLGTDLNGKPIRYNRTFHGTEKQAEKALALFYAECEAGLVNKENVMKISDLCDVFKSEYAERFLKISAQRSVNTCIRSWIVPYLGTKKVAKIKRLDVQKFINLMTDKGLSPKTIKNYYSVFRTIMNFAVDMDIIPQSPCHNIRLPKNKPAPIKYYSGEDVKLFLRALDELPSDEIKFKAAMYIALFGGLRKGEILGLNWEDVDFDSRTIQIRRTRMTAPHHGVYEDSPKTEESKRTVSLPQEVFSLLHSVRSQQLQLKLMLQNKYENTSAVFQGNLGGPLHPLALHRWLDRFVKENNLPPITLHGLRHTHASMLAYMEADKMQISKRLGHSQLTTTLNIYTHLFEKTDADIANSLSSEYLSAR